MKPERLADKFQFPWLKMLSGGYPPTEPNHVAYRNIHTGENITHKHYEKLRALELATPSSEAGLCRKAFLAVKRTAIHLIPAEYFFNREYANQPA